MTTMYARSVFIPVMLWWWPAVDLLAGPLAIGVSLVAAGLAAANLLVRAAGTTSCLHLAYSQQDAP